MSRLHYSLRSRADLEDIWDYIAGDSLRRAETVLDRIHAKIETLRQQPIMGHRRDDVHRGSRCVTGDGYMIFYRYKADVVHIDRIVHHSRQLSRIIPHEP